MMSKSGSPKVRCSWTLLLGPGPTLGEALPFLEALAQTRAASAPTGIEQLEEWSVLFCDLPEVGRILVDASSIELQDVGLLRAFMERSGGWELALLGSDSSPRALRELLHLPGAGWIPSPLDLESLAVLLRAPGAAAGEPSALNGPHVPGRREQVQRPAAPHLEPSPAPPARDTQASRAGSIESPEAEGRLLAQVERILRGESPPAGVPCESAPDTQVSDRPEPIEAALALVPAPELVIPKPRPLDSPPPPAPYFKHQVADLADLVQCVDLGLDQASMDVTDIEGPAADRLVAQFDQLRGEVARLRQFTHTLSFLASPPASGHQSFDLAPLLEEMLSSRRSAAQAPRYLLRAPEALPIRSDKILLSQAFDAMLFLCQECAEDGGTVRVDGRVLQADPEHPEGTVQVSIRFPAGRFEKLDPAQILEPYALRRDLPELGANSLAAATGIVRGQGGSVELHKEPHGGLEWLVQLPLQP